STRRSMASRNSMACWASSRASIGSTTTTGPSRLTSNCMRPPSELSNPASRRLAVEIIDLGKPALEPAELSFEIGQPCGTFGERVLAPQDLQLVGDLDRGVRAEGAQRDPHRAGGALQAPGVVLRQAPPQLGEHARRLRAEQVDKLGQQRVVALQTGEELLAVEGMLTRRRARHGELGEIENESEKIAGADRLGHVGVHPRLQAGLAVSLEGMGG